MKVKIKRKTTLQKVIRRKKSIIALWGVVITFLGIITFCGIAADAAICFKIFESDNPMNVLKHNMITILCIAVVTSISGNIVLTYMGRDRNEDS